jgi:hypothetical protein
MESADSVRQYLTLANEEIFNEIKTTEKLQLGVYNEFLDLLTNDLFFVPILQSKSKELVGRFCINSRIAIRAVYRTYGTCEFVDTPGHFEIEFTSSGLPNVSSAFDQYFSQSLTTHLSPYAQNNIRFTLSTKGWKCWWREGKFSFQPNSDAQLIADAGLLSSLFPSTHHPTEFWPRTEPVHKSHLCYDWTSMNSVN